LEQIGGQTAFGACIKRFNIYIFHFKNASIAVSVGSTVASKGDPRLLRKAEPMDTKTAHVGTHTESGASKSSSRTRYQQMSPIRGKIIAKVSESESFQRQFATNLVLHDRSNKRGTKADCVGIDFHSGVEDEYETINLSSLKQNIQQQVLSRRSERQQKVNEPFSVAEVAKTEKKKAPAVPIVIESKENLKDDEKDVLPQGCGFCIFAHYLRGNRFAAAA
jgi:hypothetical protein